MNYKKNDYEVNENNAFSNEKEVLNESSTIEKENQQMSVLSLIGFTLSIAMYWVRGWIIPYVSFAAVLVSILGIIDTKKDRKKGRRFAIAGLVISLMIIPIIILLMMFSKDGLY